MVLSQDDIPRASNQTEKCRYKTGKCHNKRSHKRNGQQHQLCLYHRDKANEIQRKFDRHKRYAERVKKTQETRSFDMQLLSSDSSHAFSSSGYSTKSHDSNFFSFQRNSDSTDSDMNSSRCSTESDRSQVSFVEQLWSEMAPEEMEDLCGDMRMADLEPVTIEEHARGHALSTDEIDFLCSAMLE